MSIQLINCNYNIICGVSFTIIAVLINTKLSAIGIRDYLLILIGSSISTAGLLEQWFSENSFITCGVIGYYMGFLSQEIYVNLKATIPDFIKDLFTYILTSLKEKIRKFLGLK